MELQKISVEGLYGTFNHVIEFKNEEQITLLIGQNGLGKTVILRMIKCFFDQDFTELKSLYFKKFILFFEDNIRITILRTENEDNFGLEFEYIKNGKPKEKPFIYKQPLQRRRYSQIHYQRDLFEQEFSFHSDMDYIIEKFGPGVFRKVAPGIWLDRARRREFTSYEILERYKDLFPSELLERFQSPKWLRNITEKVKARIIETQRLLNRIKSEDGKYKSAVVEFSQEIIDKIKSLRAAASDLASKLDRTYPKRLLEKIQVQDNITSQQIIQRLEELENKRKILNDVGLIDTEEQYIQPYIQLYEEGIIKNVLMLYINDSNSKLEIYNDLGKRISLFLTIINKRFLFKEFKIDKNAGFTFRSTINRTEIPLIGLSSGEQHELVLFYQLLFSTSPGSLVLIDEPEISLHISWQKQFIDDLKEVIKINKMDIVIATHSPDIIGSYWDLAIQLEGINSEQ